MSELTDRRTGLFSGEILQVLYETSVLEDYVKQNKIEADQGPEHDEFWQRYLATKIFLDRKPLPRRERNVRDVAERLCQGTGNDSPEALRKCLLALCYQPHRILTSAPLPPFQPVVMYFDPTLYRQRS